MKENLVAGKYFAKKDDLVCYIEVEGIGNFLQVLGFIILNHPLVNTDSVKTEFMRAPEDFILVEESSIWPKPDIENVEVVKIGKKVIKKVTIPEEIITNEKLPIELIDDEVSTFKTMSEEEGRDFTINQIVRLKDIPLGIAEATYNKYI
jgi:hypothetical protein